MVRLTDFNLKVRKGYSGYCHGYYLHVDNKKTFCSEQGGRKPLNDERILLEVNKWKKGVVVMDWSQEKYIETFYKWVEKWNSYLVKLSPYHLELLKQVIVREEQQEVKLKELKKEVNRQLAERKRKHNQKVKYVILDLKSSDGWTAEYQGKIFKKNWVRVVKNKKTGEVIAGKNDWMGCNVDFLNKGYDKVLREIKKVGVINKIVSVNDYKRLLDNSEYKKIKEINV